MHAEETAWEALCDAVELNMAAGTDATIEEVQDAKEKWIEAANKHQTLAHEFHQHPESALEAEDDADTRATGSAGYQGGE